VTPEPKAPASDLDAAVSNDEWQIDYHAVVGVSAYLQRQGLPDSAKAVERMLSRAAAYRNCRDAHAALSSQSQAAEGMAKALEPFANHSQFYRHDSDDHVPCNHVFGPSVGDHRVTVGDFQTARTALSHYRTLGGE